MHSLTHLPPNQDKHDDFSTDIICQTIVQHCRTSDLELTATCCVKLRVSLYFQIQT